MKFLLAVVAVLSCYILFPDMAYATIEHATFESFYRESSTIGWVVAALFAIAAGAAIFFTGGTASPIVVGIGSWIGGLMGLSGIAATNAGLALLGGGAIASGGFGMIGGAALITAALSFSTDIVVDYTVGKAVSEYSYTSLEDKSKNLLTLPIPVNKSGSDSYEDSIDLLGKINSNEPISSNSNQGVIRKAINILTAESSHLDADELLKNETLLSLLYFTSNEYIKAKEHATTAIKDARTEKLRRTLPAFIYAASSLYEERFDFSDITENYFRYSVLAEPKNPLIPLLFSIYLDRMSLRFNDGSLDEADTLNRIFMLMKTPALKDKYLQNYIIIQARYFIHLKLEQQKISYLTTSSNKKIKASSKTLSVVNKSFSAYKGLLKGANLVMNEMLSLPSLDDESRAKVIEFHSLLVKYIDDKNRLESLVKDLTSYQDSNISKENIGINNLVIIVIALILLIVVVRFARKKRVLSDDDTEAK